MSALNEYLTRYDAAAGARMRELDAAIRAAAPELESAVKWRVFVYTVDGDWKHWIVGLNATKDAVHLRFLYGVLLADPLHVLRPGSSLLTSWDVPRDGAVDTAAVGAYVTEAVGLHDRYRADARAIAAEARARAKRP
ncbi:DUF1801 domain-containing protein [Geodermatophilus sp. URMC 64]